MFDVFGDEITWEGQPVAKFVRPRWPSLKINAAAALSEWRDPDAAYEEGHAAGYDNAEKYYRGDLDDLQSQVDRLQAEVCDLQAENDSLSDQISEMECP